MKDMKSAYPGAIEVIPHNAPILRGKSILMSCFVEPTIQVIRLQGDLSLGLLYIVILLLFEKIKYSEVGV